MIKQSAFAILFMAIGSQSFGQTNEFRNQIKDFARDIGKILKDEKQSQVAIAEFTGPPNQKTSTGPMIQQVLIEELTKLRVEVNENAFFFVGGNFFVLEQNNNLLEIRINLRIDSKAGKRIDEMVRDIGILGNDDIVKLLAMNTDQSNSFNADRETINKKLKIEINNPPIFLLDSQVKTTKQSPYGVELLSYRVGETEMKPKLLKPVIMGGKATVDIPQGSEYIVRLRNNSSNEAAILLTIDGVDLFQFYSSVNMRPSMLLVPAGKTIDLQGWPIGPTIFKAFLVGRFADGAANQVLKGNSSIGTITASFYPSWHGQPPDRFAGARASSQIATGLGKNIEQKTDLVSRTVGPLLEAVSIRYTK